MTKEISEIILVDGLKYTEDHDWAKKEGGRIRIGITDYAQDQLGDIVFVEMPEAGSEFSKGDEFGTLESTKAVVELYMPVSGKVAEINYALEDEPELVNSDPYEDGWILKVEPGDPSELDTLMEKDAYFELLKGL